MLIQLLSFCASLQLMCTVDDLKEMGIPLGPRKKLAKFVKEKAAQQVYKLYTVMCLVSSQLTKTIQ